MAEQHKISEYIDNLSLKRTFCKGFRPDDVYEVICELTSMYNGILSESYDENEKLKDQILDLNKENEVLQAKIEDRTIQLEKAGTIAEASFQLNKVLEAAQSASSQYLDNIRHLNERTEESCAKKEAEKDAYVKKIMEDTRLLCVNMESSMREKCEDMEKSTVSKCEARERESEERCAALEQKAKEEAENCWRELSARLEEYYSAHEGLKQLLSMTGLIQKE